MNTTGRFKSNRISSSLGLKLWLPFVVGAVVILVIVWGVVAILTAAGVYGPADDMLRLALIVTLVTLVAAGGVGWLIARRVLRPLRELREGAAALAGGEQAHRIDIRTGDELELLACEFNTMAESLQRSQEQLAAAAQEQARQAEDMQTRLREMTTLLEAGHAITSLDLEDVLDQLAAEAARAVLGDQCLIFLKDTSGGLVVRGAWGLGKPEYRELRLGRGESAAGWVMLEGHPLFLADAQADQRVVPKMPTDRLLSSILAVPLLQEGRPVGVLQVARRSDAAPFALEDQPQLLPFARQAVAAWKNAQLYEEERRRARELGLVGQIARTISASLDLEATLNAILASVREVVPYDLAEICLWEPGEGVLRTRALGADPRYATPNVYPGDVYTLQEGLTGWIARRREPLLIGDLTEEKRVAPKADRAQFPIRSHVGVPLLIGDELVGTLELASYTPHTFTPTHVTTLQMVASQAAGAIQNARLFQETRRRAEQLATLHDAALEISSHLGLGRILRVIIERAVALLGAQGGALFRVDAERQILTAIVSYPWETGLTGATIQFDEGLAGRVAQKRQPIIVNDYRHWEGRIARYEETFAAALSVPLIWQDELIGVLEVWGGAPDRAEGPRWAEPKAPGGQRKFSDDDLRLLMLFTSQAAVALQNANLYEQVMRRVEEMSALTETTMGIVSELDPDRLLEMIVQRATELLHATGGTLHRYNPVEQTSRLIVSYNMGRDYRGIEMKKGEGLAGHILESEQPLIVNDYQTWAERSPQFAESQFTAAIGAPLAWQDRMLGVLVVVVDGRQTPRTFDLNDLRLLTMFAAQAAVSIQNADLYQETCRRVMELATLTEIGRALSSTLDVNELLRLVYEQTQRIMHAENMYIALYDEARDEVEFALSMNVDEVQPGTRRSSQRGLTGHVIHTGRTLFLRGAQRVAEFLEAQGIEAIGPLAVAWLGVPMMIGERVLGMLTVQHYTDPQAYDDHHRALLEAIAAQAAIALDNARLYQVTDVQLQQRVEELTALATITQELNATLDMSLIFDRLLTEAMRATEAEYASIYLLDAAQMLLHREAVRGYEAAAAPDVQAMGQGIIGRVVATGQLAVVDDVTQDAGYLAIVPGVRSELCVPISYAGSTVGAINLESPQLAAFGEEHVRFVSALASQAAIAIGNVRQLEDQKQRGYLLRQRAEQLANLFEISQAFRSDRPVESVLDDVAHAIQETVGFEIVLISLLEGEPPIQRYMAAAGIPVVTFGQIKAARPAWAPLEKALRDEFCISQSYYFPMEKTEALAGLQTFQVSLLESGPRQPGRWHPDDLLLVPLRGSGGRILGTISVDEPRDGRIPNRSTIETLELFANQAAAAMENSRLYKESVMRSEELSTLLDASAALSASLELKDVLTSLADHLAKVLRAAGCAVSRWDRDKNCVVTVVDRFRYTERPRPAEETFDLKDYPLTARVLEQREPVVIGVTDPEADPHEVAVLKELGFQALLMLPLVARRQGAFGSDTVLGLIEIYDDVPGRRFTDAEIRLAQTLADQAGMATSNAQLFEEIRGFSQESERRVEERTNDLRRALDQLTTEHSRVETLFRITSELSASLDLDRVLNRALSLVINAIGATRGSIMLVDSETDVLIHRAALGHTPPLPPGGRPTLFRRGEGLAGWVIQKQRPAIVKDVQTDDRWVQKPETPTDLYRSALVVPLMAGDDVLGALMLFNAQPDYFTEDHLRLVDAAARQVAISINNAELYRLIRDQAERLGAMLRAQQEEASKSQAILEAVADGVMVANAQSRVILFNAAAERILGIGRAEITGRSTDDLLGLYGAAGVAWVQQVRLWTASAGARLDVPTVEQRLQIEGRHIHVHVAPVTLGDEYLGTVSIFRDITKEVEADRAKSDFVSTVSHELRTPMTSIKGYADLMLLGAAGLMNDDQRRFVSIIKANADRLTVLVNDLLDISRMEGGRVELDIKAIPFDGVAEQVSASLRGKIEEKGLRLFVNVPPDLPAVMADRDRLIQIVTNLVGNAYQYTPSGGSITVSAHIAEGMMQVDVTDTGIGIAPENQSKVFDRFFRADDPAVQEFPGTGLGLAIVKTLVEMQHGRIWLQSELGQGTTFSFTTPLAEEETPAGPAQPAPPKLVSFRNNGNPRRVLVVEDDEHIAELICRHLQDGGYSVSSVGRAEEALQAARHEHPDLITLDIYLPGTDGFELLQTLKSDEETADIPVVIVSVLPDKKHGLRLGAVDYLTKPIDDKLLLDTVGRVLAGTGKVVVVDDDHDTLGLLRQTLTALGFHVHTATNGQRALELVRQEIPDLILLDLKLPGGIDGYQVLTQLKQDEDTANIPVIVITGSLTDEEVKQRRVLALGAARFLTKPFEIDDLIAEIRQFINTGEATLAGP